MFCKHIHDGYKRKLSDTEFCPLCENPLTITQWNDTDGLHICEIDKVCESCGKFRYIWAYGQTYIEVDGELVDEI